jgi:hypothetical protein
LAVLPRFRRGAFAVFALTFLVTLLLGDRSALKEALTFVPSEVLAGHDWWAPLTALFRYPEGLGLLGLLWTLAVQWVIGSRLDGFWGTTRYLIMVLVAGVVGYAGVLGVAAAVPTMADFAYAGAQPMDMAAIVAFAWVFARERLHLGSAELSPLLVAGIAGAIVLFFPVLTALIHGTPVAGVWPALIPGVLAAVVATVFVQPWRQRPKSGKVGRETRRGPSHLRVVRTPDDMLN